MNNRKKADALDIRLKKELVTMLEDGYTLAPISRPALQKRLGLKSRGTLAVDHRAQLIDEARLKQLALAGLDSDGKKKRNGPVEQNKLLNYSLGARKRCLGREIGIYHQWLSSSGVRYGRNYAADPELPVIQVAFQALQEIPYICNGTSRRAIIIEWSHGGFFV